MPTSSSACGQLVDALEYFQRIFLELQQIRGERGHGGRPQERQRTTIEGGEELARLRVQEQVLRADGRQTPRGVACTHRGDLDAQPLASSPRRHQQQRCVAGLLADFVVEALRHSRALEEREPHGLDQCLDRSELVQLREVEPDHGRVCYFGAGSASALRDSAVDGLSALLPASLA